ncbi:hypothetical protein [Lelliottia amnigena]|uniref:hypothetical protein n=1 Tax=Lelliottia amnigena TaxID=61646 RepID=UPI00195D3855|nr:hypothetical protein [Lelliottia amnigena]MBM7354597.1 hypothetical protein [Lelliottia amnigena]WSO20980.1 hypothetical protein VUJ45_07380 [Lelliottia amnigena]
MKKVIIFIVFFVFSCANSVPTFSPEGSDLPDGVMGRNYLAEVEITNAVLFKENVNVDISPIGSGLKWEPEVSILKRGGGERGEEDYHHIIISGKPKDAGEIVIHINGYSMGTSAPGRKIDKVYVIRINKDGK